MLPKLELTRMAQAMAAHAGARMGIVARNAANADTPGYKAQDLPDFAATYRGAETETGTEMRATRAGHLRGAGSPTPVPLVLDLPADPNGNSVSVEGEMMRAAGIRQQHDMALAVYSRTSDIVKLALGRGR
ncbi:FlgB family protein [Szabonella alba]|uniref:FlgB family protein n=1 Tax=Szabonella alba TaxID=2804194 RepID=A0A8K0Y0D7_9RHOB|nr:FlgB family protein [Szabonella alba]MBL4917013.1 FlgB family protein [Szabonella alba]